MAGNIDDHRDWSSGYEATWAATIEDVVSRLLTWRTLTASGSLTEVVRLAGNRAGLSDEELEKFVQSFPVEMI